MAVDQTTQSESARLTASKEQYVARGVATSPIFVERAHGARLTDVDGREYIDFVGGIGTLNGGHTPEAVVRAVQEQAERYMHQCFSIAMYEPYIEVCRRICALHPGSFAKKAMLVNSGAEAVENAVKIARYATNRDAVIAFDQGFHGRTMLGMTLTSKVMPYKKGFGPFMPEVYRAAAPWPYRGIGTVEALASVRKLLKSQVDPASVAAIVYEPVQGEGGFLPATPGFVEGLIEICREHGMVYIDDEVQTGMGRTGTVLAVDQMAGVEPDLVVWGKSLGGGLPLAGVSGRAELMDAPHVGGLGGTFGGNPLSCAAGLVSLDQVEDPAFLARAREIGEIVTSELTSMQDRHALIGDVRGMGPMIGIELVTDRVSKEPAAEQAGRVVALARERGLMLMGAGIYSNVVRILVPLVVGDEDLRAGLDILDGCLADA
ncbi:MAG: 4-aminobutyrate aminotransferase / (S)-3-amino-2-methylpropionate transaminase / 5-aminovalerate [Gaiellales bacterium]|jgi:4-aminobutyrate aminotransferase|nr:4-aminobutyrate aminotransferase / (S)-3-amino-2-methylpropionate transaminase / 5-aminovalerate [Gaiellales bacterium]